ncbi:probable aflatoxin biosynthesis ketoreductase nor-1 [Phialocephala subalpina]|uniref:Probable aflatoxin biosynthesis ketoreductase nor-1 n=1 Tax=Phialocephala subalpina TaxID=576137 RepID=A0A1L7XSC2_9HELO|nr:probable aflatoxin biosynthesis ketoreductase nor-1 [Phialocephala subalpina]
MTKTIVLITGANRGIGKGLLGLYLAKPNHLVIAANRNPDHPTSKELSDLPKAKGTSLLVVKIDSTVATDTADAVKELESKGIDHIDIIIANAGIAQLWPTVVEVQAKDIQEHIDTNIYGWIHLFQGTLPILKKSKNPIWVTIGSAAAFLENYIPIRNAAYAPTKLVQHYWTKEASVEEPTLTAFPIDPGWVQTEIGNRGARLYGIEKATTTIEESTEGILKVIDTATKETHSGKMWTWEGKQVPW